VYTWGRNDEGNLGIGDTFGPYDKQMKADRAE
jgi:alpha-tubulin suppressor-like RCC1 family protein